jgi:rhodanese-related sulfurtransferase
VINSNETISPVTAETEIPEADAASVFQWLKSGDAVLVDVREIEEYASEHVSGSLLSPLSMFEPDSFPSFDGKRVVLLCAIGKRSAAAAKQLAKIGYTDVINLTGGLEAWKIAGCPTSQAA